MFVKKYGQRGIKLIDLELELLMETDKAMYLSNGDKQVWLPKSQVDYDRTDGIATLPEWIAKDKELV